MLIICGDAVSWILKDQRVIFHVMPVSWFGLLLFCIGLSAHPDSEYQTHLLILHPSIFVDVFNSIQFKILLT
jgi:hypothetical protein